MNRAERRRLNKQAEKEPTMQMKPSDIEQMQIDAASRAFTLLLSIPATIIYRNYGELNRLEVNGKSRVERFVDMCLDMYERIETSAVKLEDIQAQFERETGCKIEMREGR